MATFAIIETTLLTLWSHGSDTYGDDLCVATPSPPSRQKHWVISLQVSPLSAILAELWEWFVKQSWKDGCSKLLHNVCCRNWHLYPRERRDQRPYSTAGHEGSGLFH